MEKKLLEARDPEDSIIIGVRAGILDSQSLRMLEAAKMGRLLDAMIDEGLVPGEIKRARLIDIDEWHAKVGGGTRIPPCTPCVHFDSAWNEWFVGNRFNRDNAIVEEVILDCLISTVAWVLKEE